ncbi:hypothetical protein [Nocardia sp. BMG51109]|uniref:hypothetical protein n=1 Tax=Nocardia sp. BMG51109 TaxID=1056816 RepID=UPI0004B3B86A|nr:hypothetical protein [Nocardia sp. BMG51109]
MDIRTVTRTVRVLERWDLLCDSGVRGESRDWMWQTTAAGRKAIRPAGVTA